MKHLLRITGSSIPAVASLTLASVVLTACMGPVKTPPVSTYSLNATPTVAQKPRTAKTLLVTSPTATATFATNKMAYTSAPFQVSYFANNRWTARPSEMLKPLMVSALQDTNHYHAVVASPFSGNATLRLDTDLIKLQQEFSHIPSQIELEVQARLVDAKSLRVIATKHFDIIEPAPTNTPYGGVIAANKAVNQYLQELSRFCLKYS
ncbi:MAG: hypothetical protein CMF50_07735 [Legionellales bacterium]|nr:hypothetical protein [Legionellales bacterium]|tara:strand:- start:3394 stop:4014 length:621 start_codon:yes stop_codon:yes gene_type:complete